MNEGSVKTAVFPAERYIIERPRLTKLLDESRARIILLIAPAGYGKTTLARQWLAQGGRRAAWYRATPASADVAALAAGLARAVAAVLPEADERMERRLHAVALPEGATDDLAETLAEVLSAWPNDAWLVIDDYHHLLGTAGERFIELIAESPVQLLTCSRRRPTWVTARRVLYGEVSEVDQSGLALTAEESSSVLSEAPTELADEIARRAQGWAAVVRLAALTGEAPPDGALAPALHRFFAEELFQAAPHHVQTALLRLAAVPTLTRRLARIAVGDDADAVLQEAVELGFISRGTAGEFDLHPLLAAFLRSKFLESGDAKEYLPLVVEALIRDARWDDGFSVIVEFNLDDLLEDLLTAGLDQLLDANRLRTLQTWVARGINSGREFSILELTEAEIALRQGRFDAGEASALQAARLASESDHGMASRAFAIAGECAHLSMREADASGHLKEAERHAESTADRRRAVWGQFVVASQFKIGDQKKLLDRYSELSEQEPSPLLRLAAGRMILALLYGHIEQSLSEGRRSLTLVGRSDDPLAATSFLYELAGVANMSGHYKEGLTLAEQAERELVRAGLQFPRSHVVAAQVASLIGLRQFKRAQFNLTRLADIITKSGEVFESFNASALQARMMLCLGNVTDAANALAGWQGVAPDSLQAEWLGLRALAVAADGALDEARELAHRAAEIVPDAQARTLAAIAHACIAVITADEASKQDLAQLGQTLLETENFESLVLGYRVVPALLKECWELELIPHQRIEALVRDSRDLKIAAQAECAISAQSRRGLPLSPREREVFALVCQGMTNREIAESLVISEMTVKVHVRHILEKLGVRSRVEAVLLVRG